ncbi:MAG: hypothetical protein RL681_302, partial [Candidatus Parcubacteria bacterium]
MANSGTRTHSQDSVSSACQNCKRPFVIEPEDFDFYKKIDVPPPTWCPECRNARRLSFRNERTLYKRPCNAPGHHEDLISIYSPETQTPVYDNKYWWSDSWDPLSFGQDFTAEIPLFEQLRTLQKRVPLLCVFNVSQRDSEYASHSYDNKDCYLVSGSGWNEHVAYANRAMHSKDSYDLYIADGCEQCSQCLYCKKSNHLFYSAFSDECTDSFFLFDCRNCSHCFGCSGLRNKSYYIFNQAYSKEDYEARLLREFDTGSYNATVQLRTKAAKLSDNLPRKFARITKSIDSTGDNISEAKRCRDSFDIFDHTEDSRFLLWAGFDTKDCFDGMGLGGGSELQYENV